MATIITRAGKGLPLTNNEVDGNFINLNNDLAGKAATIHSHTEATTSDAGFLSGSDKTKLNSIASGATANSTDVQLRDRTTHTGEQPVSSITGLQTTLNILTAADWTFSYSSTVPDNAGGEDGDFHFYVTSEWVFLYEKASGTWGYTGVKWVSETGIDTLLDEVVHKSGAETVAGVKTFSNRSVHAGAYTPTALSSHSSTPTFDCSTSNVFEPTPLTGNVTSITLSNPVAGQTVQIRFVQDGTGGRTVAVPAGAKVDGDIETAANRVSWLIMTYSSRASRWEGNWLKVPA